MKLFLSTFILIFLAELGDKTQLAAMAKSIEGRMTVFLAASLALICSTLIAVLFGEALTRLIPERILQAAAAILFIVFGIVMLYNLWAAPSAVTAAPTEPGRFARFVAQTAIAFEEAAEADYRRLAQATDNKTTKSILLALAAEERAHAEQMKKMKWDDSRESWFEPIPSGTLPELEDLLHDVAAQEETSDLIKHAIEHELATAAFYETIARTAKLSGIKQTLQRLAAAERGHADRLQALK